MTPAVAIIPGMNRPERPTKGQQTSSEGLDGHEAGHGGLPAGWRPRIRTDHATLGRPGNGVGVVVPLRAA